MPFMDMMKPLQDQLDEQKEAIKELAGAAITMNNAANADRRKLNKWGIVFIIWPIIVAVIFRYVM